MNRKQAYDVPAIMQRFDSSKVYYFSDAVEMADAAFDFADETHALLIEIDALEIPEVREIFERRGVVL